MNPIDEYLKSVPESKREHLERIRKIVKSLVPDAIETIGYGIPTLKYKGKNLIHFAAFSDHLSIFPTAKPLADLSARLSRYTTSKGTLQFSEEDPVSEEIIKELIEIRLAEIDKQK